MLTEVYNEYQDYWRLLKTDEEEEEVKKKKVQ